MRDNEAPWNGQLVCVTALSALWPGRALHVVETDADCPSMSLELLDSCELHDGTANIPQSVGRQVGTRDVLDKRAQVDA